MNRLKNYLIAALGFAVVMLTLSFVNIDHAIAQIIQRVRVVNTAAEPVPTVAQGTTNIAGNVGITGTPNVNVVNLKSHFVVNTHYNLAPVATAVSIDCVVRQIDGFWIKCELPNPHPGVQPPPFIFVNSNLIVTSDK